LPGPHIKAALFDLDDTLLDRKSGFESVYRLFYDQQPAINRSTPWEEARRFFWTLSPNNAINPRIAFLAIKQRWPGVKSGPEAHYKFYADTLSSIIRPVPGAPQFIEDLNATGMPWGVVTNGNNYQHIKVTSAGLEGKIPFVLPSAAAGADKPAPEIYHEAVRLLETPGLAPQEVLFIGDNPYTDILGAHNVGMATAWLRMGRDYPADAPVPDLTIDSLDELRPVLGI
jgi:putative hydrolase of the HAD superfamily